jgi:drug/metabolite transporter (DMT)-like permease
MAPDIVLVAVTPSLLAGSGWVGDWSPGIGDPTFLGWLTVFAYAFATWLCYRLRNRFSANADAIRRKERQFWTLMTGILLFLCINKQLDLQTAMTEFLRSCAKAEGWYDIRFKFQLAFIIGMLLCFPIGVAVILYVARRLPRATKLAGAGLAFIGVYVLIRASSFHHMDRLINARILNFKLNWFFELGGIAVVLVGVRRRSRQLDRGPY